MIRSQVVGYEVLIIVQCKDYKRKVDIEKVDSLLGTIEDVTASKGILVSDSGFTDGAIKRATEDGRVELVSVVDVENSRLKSRISIPTVCEILGVETFSFQITGTGVALSTITQDVLNEVKNNFARLWNEEKLATDVGEHEHSEVVIETPVQMLGVKYSYKVIKRYFYKEVGLQKGSGVYNVLKGTFQTQGISTESINFSEVINSWQEVNVDLKSKAVLTFGIVSALPELLPSLS